jgi:hypothetical protein
VYRDAQEKKPTIRRSWAWDYVYGSVAPRVRLFQISAFRGVVCVAWAEIDQFNVFCELKFDCI